MGDNGMKPREKQAGPGSGREQLLQLLVGACQLLASGMWGRGAARSSTAEGEAGRPCFTGNLIFECWQLIHPPSPKQNTSISWVAIRKISLRPFKGQGHIQPSKSHGGLE